VNHNLAHSGCHIPFHRHKMDEEKFRVENTYRSLLEKPGKEFPKRNNSPAAVVVAVAVSI